MIKFYVRLGQLANFLDYREPVQLVPNIIDDGWVELTYPLKDVDIKIYTTYATIEIKKKRSKLWQKIKSIHQKN